VARSTATMHSVLVAVSYSVPYAVPPTATDRRPACADQTGAVASVASSPRPAGAPAWPGAFESEQAPTDGAEEPTWREDAWVPQPATPPPARRATAATVRGAWILTASIYAPTGIRFPVLQGRCGSGRDRSAVVGCARPGGASGRTIVIGDGRQGHHALVGADKPPAALVHLPMVSPTDRDKIGKVSRAALRPVAEVVHLPPVTGARSGRRWEKVDPKPKPWPHGPLRATHGSRACRG
jgi:hypothetical protein